MKAPLVSVAMVTCNVERFLAEAIESILNQTFRDFEFIIVDFGSADASPSIIRRYQEKDGRVQFDVIPHCNLSEARNDCCFRASGKYLALLDADDVAFPDRLAHQVDYLEGHPEVGILGGGIELIDEAGRRVGAVINVADDAKLRKALLSSSPFCASTIMMRTDTFRAAGGYRRAFADASEDYDLWQRVMERCRGAKLTEAVAQYRYHPDQIGARRLRELSIGECVVRASRRIRSQGKTDPVDSADSITPQLVSELGISEVELQNALLKWYYNRVLNVQRINPGGSTLPLVNEMLAVLAESRHAANAVAAETWFAASRAYWGRGDALNACRAVFKAQAICPSFAAKLVGRAARRLTQLLIRRGSMIPTAYLHSSHGPNGATTQR